MNWKPMVTVILIYLFLLPCSILFSQTDTVSIFQSKSGIGYSKYLNVWFYQEGYFGYDASKMNKQDSIVMLPQKLQHCFKIYDKNRQLVMLGAVPQDRTYFKGEVNYYYANGKLKTSTYLDNVEVRDSCQGGKAITVTNTPAPWGTWKYYGKEGRISKTVSYWFVYSCNPRIYELMKKTTCYDKEGNPKKPKTKIDTKF